MIQQRLSTTGSPRRSWLFVEGANQVAIDIAASSGTDVAILDLEDFTPRHLKEEARVLVDYACSTWKKSLIEAAIRINPLDEGGQKDLVAALSAGATIIVMAKVESAAEIEAVDRLIDDVQSRTGQDQTHVEIVPVIESAKAVSRLQEIVRGQHRVKAAILASEDLAQSMGVMRTAGSIELEYARQRFFLECHAEEILPIDCPFTFDKPDEAVRDLEQARLWGYTAKSAVAAVHISTINATFTPSENEVSRARSIIEVYESAQASGSGRAFLDGHLVETPTYKNALLIVSRASH